jgi:hypothetical protein
MTTNNNNKKKQSAARKLIPAIGMLTVSAMMLSSSTYAWFTMNKEVQVTGMEVKTKVGSNLLICTTNLDADYTSQTLSQTRKALLEPVSSISGATGSFYYTVNAKANGDAVTDAYVLYNENAETPVQNATAGKPNYDPAFNAAYKLGTTTAPKGTFTSSNIAMSDSADGAAYGYIDYTFYLKATTSGSASTTAQKLIMTHCDLDYNDGVLDNDGTVGKVGGPDQAWRVAVFAQNVTSDKPGNGAYATDICTYTAGVGGADPTTNQKGLISLAGATNQTAGNAVVSTTSAAGTVYNAAAANGVVLDTISTDNASVYYKVVVRLWLEGEDKTCTSETYAALTNKYNLDLEFELTDGSAGGVTDGSAVTNISSTGNPDNGWDPTAPSFEGNQFDGQA